MVKKIVILLAAAVLLVGTVGTVGVVLAQEPTPTPTAGPQEIYKTFLERVASILGIEAQKLSDAIAQAQKEMLDEGLLPKGGPLGKIWRHRVQPLFTGYQVGQEAAAEALGMTQEELIGALGEGKTLAQLAEDKGMSQEQFADAFSAAVEAKLQNQVEAGAITQQQAETIAQHLKDWLARAMEAQLVVPPALGCPGLGQKWHRGSPPRGEGRGVFPWGLAPTSSS